MKKLRRKNLGYSPTLSEIIKTTDEIIIENPELSYDDFDIDLSYSSCYYESDMPQLALDYLTEETEVEAIFRLKQEEIYQRRVRNDTVKIIKPPEFKK